MNNVSNQNGKVLKETLASANPDARPRSFQNSPPLVASS